MFPWFGEVLAFSVDNAALGAPPSTVPEPATLALAALGGGAALLRGRSAGRRAPRGAA